MGTSNASVNLCRTSPYISLTASSGRSEWIERTLIGDDAVAGRSVVETVVGLVSGEFQRNYECLS